MAGWDNVQGLIPEETKQLIEEGVEPAAAQSAADEARSRLARGLSETEVWSAFSNLPRRADFPFDEPSDLETIRRLRIATPPLPKLNVSDEVLFDKMHGAWLGRCAGCALGKPVEGFMSAKYGLSSWQRQKTYLAAISPDEWPLRDFIPKHSPGESKTGNVFCPQSMRENIAFMESDDDIRYTVLGQIITQQHGRQFGSAHVANAWLERLSYVQVCTAETQAYRNLVIAHDGFRHIKSPAHAAELDAKTDWKWVTHHVNPYREWIGAQIRVDSYGYAAAGDPALAAEFAWRDARISHVKNGIYGAMFCAAMIAAAYVTDDPRRIIEAGLAEIPSTSRLYQEMRQVIDLCARHENRYDRFEQVIEDIYQLLGHYHPVHTNNNAALCVMALLLSGGDFHRGITLAVMGGWDTDCNGATVGSIVGAVCGGRRVPGHWSARLNDTLKSQVVDYHPIAISECARRSVAIARRIAGESSTS